jgi:hypothetical protein
LTGAGDINGTGNGANNVITAATATTHCWWRGGRHTCRWLRRRRIAGGTGRHHDRRLGNDTFGFTGLNESGVDNNDLITDFEGDGVALGDIIDLSVLDANAGVGGNQAFTFIGTAAFSAAGQLRYSQVGGETIIQANTNSSISSIEFELRLSGIHNLTGGDFIL